MSQEATDPELTALEAALTTLAPLPCRLSRDRLMFQAGKQAGRVRWIWPGTAAALALLAAGLGVALMIRPKSQPEERIVYVPIQRPANSLPATLPSQPEAEATVGPEHVAESAGMPRADYLQLRERVLRLGVDALPAPPSAIPAQPSLTLDQLLDMPPSGVDPATLQRFHYFKNSGGPT